MAFGLILPMERAKALARDWFRMFADDETVDSSGRYLYRDWRDHPRTPTAARHRAAVTFRLDQAPDGQSNQGMYDWLLVTPPAEIEERLLSFSDLHLDLIALSSADLRLRVLRIRHRDPHVDTDRRCQELKAAVENLIK